MNVGKCLLLVPNQRQREKGDENRKKGTKTIKCGPPRKHSRTSSESWLDSLES